MEVLIVLFCVPIAIGIYRVIVKPFITPLSRRIPTGKEYRATLGVKRS